MNGRATRVSVKRKTTVVRKKVETQHHIRTTICPSKKQIEEGTGVRGVCMLLLVVVRGWRCPLGPARKKAENGGACWEGHSANNRPKPPGA